jgi:hypothetical protein
LNTLNKGAQPYHCNGVSIQDLEARLLIGLRTVKFWRERERTWQAQGKRELVKTARKQLKLVEDTMRWNRDQLRARKNG